MQLSAHANHLRITPGLAVKGMRMCVVVVGAVFDNDDVVVAVVAAAAAV